MSQNPLSPNEAALLRAAPADAPFAVSDLLDATGLRAAQAEPAAEALVARGLLDRDELVSLRLVIGDAGRAQAEGGVPELRMRARLADGPAAVRDVQDLPGLEKSAVGSAFGGSRRPS